MGNRLNENIRNRLFVEVYNVDVLECLPSNTIFEQKEDLVLLIRFARYDKITNREWGFVTTEHLDLWNIDEDILRRDAWRNTRKRRGPILKEISDVINPDYKTNLLHPDAVVKKSNNPADDMYAIINAVSVNAAVYMFDTETMGIVAEKLDSNLIIIPSSIHDLAICRDIEGVDLEKVRVMLKFVNRNLIMNSWELSDEIYRYDREKKEISIIREQIQEQEADIQANSMQMKI